MLVASREGVSLPKYGGITMGDRRMVIRVCWFRTKANIVMVSLSVRKIQIWMNRFRTV
jgi:hypothetical protein